MKIVRIPNKRVIRRRNVCALIDHMDELEKFLNKHPKPSYPVIQNYFNAKYGLSLTYSSVRIFLNKYYALKKDIRPNLKPEHLKIHKLYTIKWVNNGC